MNKPMMMLSLKASESMGHGLEVNYLLQVARIEPQALLLGYRDSDGDRAPWREKVSGDRERLLSQSSSGAQRGFVTHTGAGGTEQNNRFLDQ